MKTNTPFLKRILTTVLVVASFSFASAQDDKVAFTNRTNSVVNKKPLSFEIEYTAKKTRDITLELKNPKTNKWVAGKTIKVKKGSGKITMKLNTKDQFVDGSHYQIGVSIRPAGTTWKENITTDIIKPFTIGKTDVATELIDKVSFVNTPTSIDSGKSAMFEVQYSATEDREINLEIKDPKTNKWIAGSLKKVEKGTGVVKMKVWSKDGIPQGEGKQIIVSIRPVGSTWKETINKQVVKQVSIK